MVILFESSGSFNTGEPSYWSLNSKRTRGKITLTDTELTFKSEIDKILYQIKINDIRDFYLKRIFTKTIIMLHDVSDNLYAIHILINKKNSYSSSKTFTIDLFHHLSRTKLRQDRPIFFEGGGVLWKEGLHALNWKSDTKKGILILTEEHLSFKPLYQGSTEIIKIIDIKSFEKIEPNSFNFIKILLHNKKIYYLTTLTKKFGRDTINHSKMEKLLELLNQVVIYKRSEKVKSEQLEKERLNQIKSMLEVSSKIRLDIMRLALKMDEKTFSNKIFQWAKKFNFVIEGNFLIVNLDNVNAFLDDLYEIDEEQDKKLCRYCQKLIPSESRNCPYCGVEIESQSSL